MKKDKLLLFIDKRWREGSSDWQADLEAINLWSSVSFLYENYDRERANHLLAYVVYGYSLHSDWLEPEKDRFENLERIMETITGQPATDEVDQAIIHGTDETINRLIDFVLDNQQDARFRDVVSNMELHALALRFNREHTDPKKLLEISTLLRQTRIQRQETMALLNEIRREFLPLNTALEKEGRKPVEPALDFTWKSNIDRRNAGGLERAVKK